MKVETAEFVCSAHHRQQFLRDGIPEVAFAGRSNVGKSSLMNRLLRRKGLARTGSTPGRTRAVNYFLINRRFYFVDLPGYGFAKAPRFERQKWAELMNQYFTRAGSLERGSAVPPILLVQLIDGKVGATKLDCEAWEYFLGLALKPLLVATKIDKVAKSRRARSLVSLRENLGLAPKAEIIACSAVTGDGIRPLWQGITEFLARRREAQRAPGTSEGTGSI